MLSEIDGAKCVCSAFFWEEILDIFRYNVVWSRRNCPRSNFLELDYLVDRGCYFFVSSFRDR